MALERINIELEKIQGNNAKSLKNLIINFYGQTIYDIFYKNYLKKYFNISGSKIDDIDWFRKYLKPIEDNYKYFNEKYVYFPTNMGYNELFKGLTQGVNINFNSNVVYNDIPKDGTIICTARPDIFFYKKEKLKYIKNDFDIDSDIYDKHKPDKIIFPNFVPFSSITQFGKFFPSGEKNIIIKEYPDGKEETHPCPIIKNKKILEEIKLVYNDIYLAGRMGSAQMLDMCDCILQANKIAAEIKINNKG